MACLPPSGRVIWYLGYSASKSVGAFTESYGQFQRVAYQEEPSYEVQGVLIDGFDSTTSSMKTLFPGARLGNLQQPGGSQGAFLTGLAHLYNLVPYQRRALHAGRTRPQGGREGVWCFSVEPGEIGLTALEGTDHGINQHAKGRLAQLSAGLTQ
jgi:hypothetical protein